MEIKFKKLHEKAVAPAKQHASDAGFDLTCVGVTTVRNECGQVLLVYHTGLAIEIPEGYVGLIFPRSSIYKKSLSMSNAVGVLDSNYRGEVMGIMRNTTDVIPAIYKDGDRFAQLVIVKLPEVEGFVEAEELSETERGVGGFGSTDEQPKQENKENEIKDSADKATDNSNEASGDSISESAE